MTDLSEPKFTLCSEMALERLHSIVKQQCRADVKFDVLAHDPQRVPQLRVLELTFAGIEDRDRFVIALRMMERETHAATQRSVTAQHSAAAQKRIAAR